MRNQWVACCRQPQGLLLTLIIAVHIDAVVPALGKSLNAQFGLNTSIGLHEVTTYGQVIGAGV